MDPHGISVSLLWGYPAAPLCPGVSLCLGAVPGSLRIPTLCPGAVPGLSMSPLRVPIRTRLRAVTPGRGPRLSPPIGGRWPRPCPAHAEVPRPAGPWRSAAMALVLALLSQALGRVWRSPGSSARHAPPSRAMEHDRAMEVYGDCRGARGEPRGWSRFALGGLRGGSTAGPEGLRAVRGPRGAGTGRKGRVWFIGIVGWCSQRAATSTVLGRGCS